MTDKPTLKDHEPVRYKWKDRSVQPRCNICGRFARWDALYKEWRLGCVWYNREAGMHEHD